MERNCIMKLCIETSLMQQSDIAQLYHETMY